MYLRSQVGPWPTDATLPIDSVARRAMRQERIARAHREIARQYGIAAEEMAALQREAAIEAGEDQEVFDHSQRSVTTESALILTMAEKTCESHFEDAAGLASRLPRTLARLKAGKISWVKARVILDETADLTVEQCLQLEEGVLLDKAERLTPSNLRRATRRVVTKTDKDAAKKRAKAAREERSMSMWDNHNGTHTIQLIAESENAIATYGVVDTLARAIDDPEDERSLGAKRVDVLVDLVTRPDGEERVRYDVGVVVGAGTLLGLNDEDGYLPGHGPIPAALCREIAADNTWRRILLDPNTGHLLDLSASRYAPSDRLAAYIRTRDQHCRWPACRGHAAHSDIDHTIEFRIGHLTICINLGLLCEKHHVIKHLPGWDLIQDPDGSGTLTFVTPTGEMFRTRPPDLMTGEDPDLDIPVPVRPPEWDEPPF